MADLHNLARFVVAQEGVFEDALQEIRQSAKRSHWMWFIFPQLAGLGFSPTSRFYAISSLEEAAAYFSHPLLGPRLVECVEALRFHSDVTAADVFGQVDALKLRSSLTLFRQAGDGALFQKLLDQWFDGQADPRTLRLLQQ